MYQVGVCTCSLTAVSIQYIYLSLQKPAIKRVYTVGFWKLFFPALDY